MILDFQPPSQKNHILVNTWLPHSSPRSIIPLDYAAWLTWQTTFPITCIICDFKQVWIEILCAKIARFWQVLANKPLMSQKELFNNLWM